MVDSGGDYSRIPINRLLLPDNLLIDVTWNKDCPHPPAPSLREERRSPENSCSPRPLGEGLGMRVLVISH
jgi:hypothetical protein